MEVVVVVAVVVVVVFVVVGNLIGLLFASAPSLRLN